MTPKDRGELVERLKACYKCTCWKHQGNQCFIRSKSNCNVVSGNSACGGVHHRLLHGSGVAFCHKVTIKAASSRIGAVSSMDHDDVSTLPDISQPVLLEIQNITVHDQNANVMFDKGSTAALITHRFAELAGLHGRKVAYWPVVI